ncbi:MAG: hypothetical protein K0R63_1631 [Rickettsiales bacterium]|jgi:prepilin-type N-terminal cleavage/methylation domain-containing protein|nr:hypothetical protein [Rickettsiales bacterium]
MEKNQAGFSFIELLLAMTVGSVILAATVASYIVVARQYARVSVFTEVQETGVPTIHFLQRDIRMAGRIAMDDDMNPAQGAITTPIALVDSGNACCDEITIIYDKDEDTQLRVRYYVDDRPDRSALFMDRDLWNSGTASWVNTASGALVADYVEDFQLVGSDANSNGIPRIIEVSLVIRSKRQQTAAEAYTKPTYTVGNYALSVTDRYYRDEFNATINIRNLR